MQNTLSSARTVNARMAQEEANRLLRAVTANPRSAFFRSVSETTGKERIIPGDVARQVLAMRGMLKGVAA